MFKDKKQLKFFAKIKSFIINLNPIKFGDRSSKKKHILILIGLLSFSVFLTSDFPYNSQIGNKTSIIVKASLGDNRIGVYKDAGCVTAISSLKWGTLSPGGSSVNTIYIKNEGSSNLNLLLETENWNPSNAPDHLTLKWDYKGIELAPNEVTKVGLTLLVSENIDGIENFSFETIIGGTETNSLYDNVYMVVQGLNNRIYYKTLTDSPYYSISNNYADDSIAAVTVGDQLHLVMKGITDNKLYHGYVTLSTKVFSGWKDIGGSTPSAPTLTMSSNNLYLVIRGQDDRIYHRYYNLGLRRWSIWSKLPSGSTIDRPAAAILDGKLHIVVRGSDGNSIWHSTIEPSTNSFGGWTKLSGMTHSEPTLTASENDNKICLVVRGLNNAIYYRSWAYGQWTNWKSLPTGQTCDGIGAIIKDNLLTIAVRGMNSYSIWQTTINLQTGTTSTWSLHNGATPSAPTLATTS